MVLHTAQRARRLQVGSVSFKSWSLFTGQPAPSAQSTGVTPELQSPCGLPSASDVAEVLLELAGSEGFQGIHKILNVCTDTPGRMVCDVSVFL